MSGGGSYLVAVALEFGGCRTMAIVESVPNNGGDNNINGGYPIVVVAMAMAMSGKVVVDGVRP